MSYDVSLYNDDEEVWDWNYTSNCAPMWRAAGADLATFHERRASECIPSLGDALVELIKNPAKYDAMNPPNGWGSRASLLIALTEMLVACETSPDAIVHVTW